MRSVLRLWFSRVGMMLAAGFLVVALAWLPAGIVQIEGDGRPAGVVWGVRTEPMQPFVLAWDPGSESKVRARWSFAAYALAVRTYLRDLAAGQVMGYTLEWLNGREVPVAYPVLPRVLEDSLVSLRLLSQALVLGMATGFGLGLLSLRRGAARGTAFGLSVAGMALPDFVVVMLLQMLTIFTHRHFGVRLYSVLGPGGGERGWLLPLVALSLGPMAYTARLVAAGLDEVMRADYIRTARAKGLPEVRVVLKHGLAVALGQVLAGLPTLLSLSLSSLVVVEVLCNVNGLGAALLANDSLPLLATVGLVFCLWFGVLDGVANTLRILANPRLREGS